MSALQRSKIEANLNVSSRALLESISVFPVIDSTNRYLKEYSSGVHLCVAEQQTAGKGRRNRDWLTTPSKNIMMSLSWQFEGCPESLSGLSLAVAAVIVEYLNKTLSLKTEIKWPNDILLGNRKLAGILVDASGEPGGVCRVVIGLGLNVQQDKGSVVIDQAWTDLASNGVKALDRNAIIADICSLWVDMLVVFADKGWQPFIRTWQDNAAFINQNVRIELGDRIIRGVLQGVDEVGRLLVVEPDGEVLRLWDAELSIRAEEGLS